MATFPGSDIDLELEFVDHGLDVLRNICKACLLYLSQVRPGEFTAEDESNMRATIDAIERAADEIYKMQVHLRLQPVDKKRCAKGLKR